MVITDWRDGPIEGIARLSAGGGHWKFKLFAEIASTEDLNERLFLLSQLPNDVAEPLIRELISDLRLPIVWPFSDQPDPAAMRSAVEVALESAMAATLVVSSVNFGTVIKAWRIEPGRT